MNLKYALAAALLVGAATPALADGETVHIKSFVGQPDFLSGTLNDDLHRIAGGTGATNSGAAAVNTEVGRFKFTSSTNVDYLAYCVDILHYIHVSTDVNDHTADFVVEPLSSYVTDATKLSRLTALLTNTATLLGNYPLAADQSKVAAAIQLATWEILFETGSVGSLVDDGAAGVLWAAGGSLATTSASGLLAGQSAISLAGQYVHNVIDPTGSWKNAASGYQLKVLYNANNQSQVFIVAVPEPATWGMMIGGFALVGGSLRSARKRKLRAFA